MKYLQIKDEIDKSLENLHMQEKNKYTVRYARLNNFWQNI